MTADAATAIAAPTSSDLRARFERQCAAAADQPYPSLAERRHHLNLLRQALRGARHQLITACAEDFGGRPAAETVLADLVPSLQGIDYARKHLRRWLRKSRRQVSWPFWPARVEVVYQPLGVVGIVVPWNYPIYLAISPLTAALAAGNRVLIKLAEATPATNVVLADALAAVFPPEQVAVVTGDAEVGAAFSALPFDHLLFTGSTAVGRKVMAAASANLTPVTLELGGKSPALVDRDCPLKLAAQRIAYGKLVNAGQTCVAPDYVLVPRESVDDFIALCRKQFARFYPDLSRGDFASIINDGHYRRLQDLLADALDHGAKLHSCQALDDASDGARRMPLQLLTGVSAEMRVMQEEIFGPLLPVVPYDNLEDALQFIAARPRPLALYYFGFNRERQDYLVHHCHAGSMAINECLLQVAMEDAPFGGVGESGMGEYHGHEGFLTFSKAKTVLRKGRSNSTRMVFPPYGRWYQRLLQWWLLR